MKRRTSVQSAHLARIKSLPCAACGRSGPSDAHHVKVTLAQSRIDELTAPLCRKCHQDSKNSAHGYGDFPNVYELLANTFAALAKAERVEVWP